MIQDLEEELKKITVTSDITDDTDTIDDVDKDSESKFSAWFIKSKPCCFHCFALI